MAIVYVRGKSGKEITPTTRCGHVRRLLREGKAKVVSTKPFTIQLLYDTDEVINSLYASTEKSDKALKS